MTGLPSINLFFEKLQTVNQVPFIKSFFEKNATRAKEIPEKKKGWLFTATPTYLPQASKPHYQSVVEKSLKSSFPEPVHIFIPESPMIIKPSKEHISES
jgi:hypothetical protein